MLLGRSFAFTSRDHKHSFVENGEDHTTSAYASLGSETASKRSSFTSRGQRITLYIALTGIDFGFWQKEINNRPILRVSRSQSSSCWEKIADDTGQVSNVRSIRPKLFSSFANAILYYRRQSSWEFRLLMNAGTPMRPSFFITNALNISEINTDLDWMRPPNFVQSGACLFSIRCWLRQFFRKVGQLGSERRQSPRLTNRQVCNFATMWTTFST